MSQLLALDATQIVLICLVALMVIAYPILISRRNKKETQRMTEQTNSLKRGDKVLTTSGVYGTILEVRQEGNSKQVTIETGNAKYKSYMTIDAYAIYQVITDQPLETAKDITQPEEKPEAQPEVKEKKKTSKKQAATEEKSKEGLTETPEATSTEKTEEVAPADKKPRRKKAN